jgi:hypothetical protein
MRHKFTTLSVETDITKDALIRIQADIFLVYLHCPFHIAKKLGFQGKACLESATTTTRTTSRPVAGASPNSYTNANPNSKSSTSSTTMPTSCTSTSTGTTT